MTTPRLLLVALLVATAAGCTGLPEGSADFGDTVTVRYSAEDVNGTLLRPERTATFVLGSGSSGLGLGFERGVRGLVVGDNATFVVSDDPSLTATTPVEVERVLQPIEMHQSAPRADFEENVEPARVGLQFPAFGIYTATVTGVTANRVNFTITTSDADLDGDADPQDDPVPSVGAVLRTTPDGTRLQRELQPTVGATFTIQPPTPSNPQTPLGLAPGAYRTLGATETTLKYGFQAGSTQDLVGKDIRFTVHVVRIVAGDHEVEPVCDGEDGGDCNYAVRDSPVLLGDPDSVLAADAEEHEPAEEDSDHGH